MSAGFGIGARGLLTDDTPDEVAGAVSDLVRQSGVALLREVVGQRVVEARWEEGRVVTRWLSGDEAAPVVAAARGATSGASYGEALGICDEETQLGLPGLADSARRPDAAAGWVPAKWCLRRPGGEPGRTLVAVDAAALLTHTARELEEPSPELLETLARARDFLERCLEHSLAFAVYY